MRDGAARLGRDAGQVDVPGARLAAVDLLQGEHVRVQGGDGRREPPGVDVVLARRAPGQHVERRDPHVSGSPVAARGWSARRGCSCLLYTSDAADD